jgi:bifunctional DNA-binding transcriptional regulator/antitoxin component of YhaV-PrlF toxin-antitoxin module
MKLIDARVQGSPREVTTKFGEKSVLDVVSTQGEFTIWRPAGDREVMGRRDGERVKIAVDSKGKASLVETLSTGLTDPHQPKSMGFAVEETAPETTRSAEIADYIQRLGKLYSHCLSTAATMPKATEMAAPEVKDIATTIFIQTVKHFDL